MEYESAVDSTDEYSEVASESEQNPCRYAIGIDLGTTNTVLSYVDLLDEDNPTPIEFAVPQLTSPGEVESKAQLPSFLYLAHESELNPGDRALPWSEEGAPLVGQVARHLGSKTPLRLVASAKSWLCHGGVDRRSAFLPLDSPEEVEKVSPFKASVLYLDHLKQAWDHQFPDYPMHTQDVILTIPASFDPAARELTADAAHTVGLENLTLLEEPQAALYSWVHALGEGWREQLQVGDIVLVVDVGGGTTDLSLVSVTEEEGSLSLNRIAVGDHILLGGDNMDLALAYRINSKLAAEGKQLQPWQIQALTHGCRDAKEALLYQSDLDAVPLVVPSRGSKLLGSTLRAELTRDDVDATLVDGFFPRADISEKPQQLARGALTQIGLPYAQDAGVTRHLAAFLTRQADAMGEHDPEAEFIKPTAILLNGGVLKADGLSQRLMDVINGWLLADGADQARLLAGANLDLAVAKGAAYFGSVRQGRGVRIRGGTANAYYVGIESAMPAVPGMPPQMQALCVAPFGMEEGASTEVKERTFGLVIGEPVRFQFYGSAVRRDDEAGVLLDFWQPDELEKLPDIEVILEADDLPAGEVVPVYLTAAISEIGTLQLSAVATNDQHRWQVEFEVRTR